MPKGDFFQLSSGFSLVFGLLLKMEMVCCLPGFEEPPGVPNHEGKSLSPLKKKSEVS